MPNTRGAGIASARSALVMVRCSEPKRDAEVEQAQDCAGSASRHTPQPSEDVPESQFGRLRSAGFPFRQIFALCFCEVVELFLTHRFVHALGGAFERRLGPFAPLGRQGGSRGHLLLL